MSVFCHMTSTVPVGASTQCMSISCHMNSTGPVEPSDKIIAKILRASVASISPTETGTQCILFCQT